MLSQDALLDGVVLPLDKPLRWTSFQAVNKVKSVVRNLYGLKKFKIGHAGTLDPLASGLLLVCIGKATKRIAELQQGDKVYSGTLVLGATTPCFDMERPIDHYHPFAHITEADVRQAATTFEGEIMQVPPMFSAVKVDGQRAYTYARLDDPTATIAPRPTQVYSFAITAFRPGDPTAPLPPIAERVEGTHLYDNPQGSVPPTLPQADFRIHCGKGTYIRSLARDLGGALGSGAMLSALRREQVGSYTLEQAVGIDEVESLFANWS